MSEELSQKRDDRVNFSDAGFPVSCALRNAEASWLQIHEFPSGLTFPRMCSISSSNLAACVLYSLRASPRQKPVASQVGDGDSRPRRSAGLLERFTAGRHGRPGGDTLTADGRRTHGRLT